MNTIGETGYKTDEKKDFTPAELTRAKTACEFVIDLTKAISRSGYYDAHHPISLEVKKGLFDAFKNALGSSKEIMLTCHDVEDLVDIHISGILEEPFNIRKLTHATTTDLFVPKLKDYFERKNLNSFVIKNHITPSHFESFIDVMSEPIAESTDASQLGEYLTKALADLDITEVSTVFKTDIVLARGKLPWRVSIILRRLAKDLKVVPMFRSASAEKMKLIKKQIVEDIIRPLNNFDLLRDLIVNCDVIVDHISHLMDVDEMETLMINSLHVDEVVPISSAVFDVYMKSKNENLSKKDDSALQKRCVYLAKVLEIAARRIVSENMPESLGLFEKLYENEIIDFDMLPEKLRFRIQSRKIAEYFMSEMDNYTEKSMNAETAEEIETHVTLFKRIIPEFIKLKKWDIIKTMMETLNVLMSRVKEMSTTSELLLNMPDSVFEGQEEPFADGYVHADQDSRNIMNYILMQMHSKCVDIISMIFGKCKEPDILKNVIELLSKKKELARQWSLKILDDQGQPLSMLNIALLLMVHVGQSEDVRWVEKYVKHSNASIRVKALSAIVKMNAKDAAGFVVDALSDGEEKVRHQAISLMEHDVWLTAEPLKRLLLFLKEKMSKKDISSGEATMISGLLRATGKNKDYPDKASLENEIIAMASGLMHEGRGLLKFIKSEPGREQQDILSACAWVLGRIGGIKSREFLKTISGGDTLLSHAALQAIDELNKRSLNK